MWFDRFGDDNCYCKVYCVFLGFFWFDVICIVCDLIFIIYDFCVDILLDFEFDFGIEKGFLELIIYVEYGGWMFRVVLSVLGVFLLLGCLDCFIRFECLGVNEKFFCERC